MIYNHELVDRHAYKLLLVTIDNDPYPIATVRFDVSDDNWTKQRDLWIKAIESINEVMKQDAK